MQCKECGDEMKKGFIANVFWVEGDYPAGSIIANLPFFWRRSVPYIAWRCSGCGKIELFTKK